MGHMGSSSLMASSQDWSANRPNEIFFRSDWSFRQRKAVSRRVHFELTFFFDLRMAKTGSKLDELATLYARAWVSCDNFV